MYQNNREPFVFLINENQSFLPWKLILIDKFSSANYDEKKLILIIFAEAFLYCYCCLWAFCIW